MKIEKEKFTIVNEQLENFLLAVEKSCVRYTYSVSEDFTEVECSGKKEGLQMLKSIWSRIKERYDLVFTNPNISLMEIVSRQQITPEVTF